MPQSLRILNIRHAVRRVRPALLVTACIVLIDIGMQTHSSAAQEARAIPAPVIDEPASQAASEVALLAGGCFWGVQGVFQHVRGVISAVACYVGGAQATATYETVSTGATRTREVSSDHLPLNGA